MLSFWEVTPWLSGGGDNLPCTGCSHSVAWRSTGASRLSFQAVSQSFSTSWLRGLQGGGGCAFRMPLPAVAAAAAWGRGGLRRGGGAGCGRRELAWESPGTDPEVPDTLDRTSLHDVWKALSQHRQRRGPPSPPLNSLWGLRIAVDVRPLHGCWACICKMGLNQNYNKYDAKERGLGQKRSHCALWMLSQANTKTGPREQMPGLFWGAGSKGSFVLQSALGIMQGEALGAVFPVRDIVLETGWVAMATAPRGRAPPTPRQPACRPVLPAVAGSLRVPRLLPPSTAPEGKKAPQISIPQMAHESENTTPGLAGLICSRNKSY